MKIFQSIRDWFKKSHVQQWFDGEKIWTTEGYEKIVTAGRQVYVGGYDGYSSWKGEELYSNDRLTKFLLVEVYDGCILKMKNISWSETKEWLIKNSDIKEVRKVREHMFGPVSVVNAYT
jgi:hypothetical protein